MAAAGFTGFFVTLSALPAWIASQGQPSGVRRGDDDRDARGDRRLSAARARAAASGPRRRAVVASEWGRSVAAPALIWANSGAGLYAICVVRGVGFAIFTIAGTVSTARSRQASTRRARRAVRAGRDDPEGRARPVSVLLLREGRVLAGGRARRVARPRGAVRGRLGCRRAPPGAARPGDGGRRAARGPRAGSAVGGSGRGGGPAGARAGDGLVRADGRRRRDGDDRADRAQRVRRDCGLAVFGATTAAARCRRASRVRRHGVGALLPCTCVIAAVGLLALAAGLSGGGAVAVLVGCGVAGLGYGAAQSLTLISAFARTGSEAQATASAVWNVAFDSGTGGRGGADRGVDRELAGDLGRVRRAGGTDAGGRAAGARVRRP